MLSASSQQWTLSSLINSQITMTTKSYGYLILFAGCIIKVLEIGTFKSFGVFVIPIEQDLWTTNIVMGACMAMHQVATDIFGELLIVLKLLP